MEQVISVDEFEESRKLSGDEWSDFEVFEESRERVDLRELVKSVVESQYTHPGGPVDDDMVGNFVYEKVYYEGLVPEELPESVKEQFAKDLDSAVREYSVWVFDDMRERVDPYDDDVELDRIRTVLNDCVNERVPESY